MTGQHAKPHGRHRAPSRAEKRRSREVITPYDAETLAVFADHNRPLNFVRRCVGTTVQTTNSLRAALAMTEAIAAMAQIGASQ